MTRDVTAPAREDRLRLDRDKPPLDSWRRTTSYYDGAQVITEFFEWSQEPLTSYVSVPGFSCIYELTDTFVNNHTGEIEDVHRFFIASGPTLEKIKQDLRKSIFPIWRNVRQLFPEFPAYTRSNLEDLLDPAADYQPKYFNTGYMGLYAEINGPVLRKDALVAQFHTSTEARSARYDIRIHYDHDGKICSLDSHIQRRSDIFDLRIRHTRE